MRPTSVSYPAGLTKLYGCTKDISGESDHSDAFHMSQRQQLSVPEAQNAMTKVLESIEVNRTPRCVLARLRHDLPYQVTTHLSAALSGRDAHLLTRAFYNGICLVEASLAIYFCRHGRCIATRVPKKCKLARISFGVIGVPPTNFTLKSIICERTDASQERNVWHSIHQ